MPEAAIDGVLMFVGYEGIVCTSLCERLLLGLTPKYEGFPVPMRAIRATRVRQYTAVQLALFALCWAVNLSPFGLGVAFVIVALVPLRERVIPRFFSQRTGRWESNRGRLRMQPIWARIGPGCDNSRLSLLAGELEILDGPPAQQFDAPLPSGPGQGLGGLLDPSPTP